MQRRVLAHSKSSLAPEGISLVYDIQDSEFEWVCDSPLRWQDLLKKPQEQPARREAGEFLQEILQSGPLAVSGIRSRAASFGISFATLRRAKDRLGIVAERVGGAADKGHWVWRLPTDEESELVARIERPAPRLEN